MEGHSEGVRVTLKTSSCKFYFVIKTYNEFLDVNQRSESVLHDQ